MSSHRAHLYRTIGIVCISISIANLVFTFVAHIPMLFLTLLTFVGLFILIVGAFFYYHNNRNYAVSMISVPVIISFATFFHMNIIFKIMLYVIALCIIIIGAFLNSRRRPTNRE